MRFTSVNDWLDWQQTLNTSEIDLGLDRVQQVLAGLGRYSKFSCPLISVAGTNGKGSVVAMLEAMAMSMGLRVGSYTSPHLIRYNERIRLNAQQIDDTALCSVFQDVDDAREDLALTYFEFGTLAAIEYFFQQAPDLVILEVGLGGRLDAVNVMDADVGIITTVDIDHVDWLGDDREQIGYEKAGIFRQHQFVVYGDLDPVNRVLERAKVLECDLHILGTDFTAEITRAPGNETDHPRCWSYKGKLGDFENIAIPVLAGEFQRFNAALSMTALLGLLRSGRLTAGGQALGPQDMTRAISAIATAHVTGRFQKLAIEPDVYVDVAHNPQAARSLVSIINSMLTEKVERRRKVWMLIAMLADKDVESVLQILDPVVDQWCFCSLSTVERGLAVDKLVARAIAAGIVQGEPEIAGIASDAATCESRQNQCTIFGQKFGSDRESGPGQRFAVAESVTSGCRQLLALAQPEDIVIIAGSFYTVAEAMQLFPDGMERSGYWRKGQ